MYTLYKFHFLKGISEINQLFDDILIIWPAPVYIYITYAHNLLTPNFLNGSVQEWLLLWKRYHPWLVLCSIHRYDDVSSQRFDDTSIDTAGPGPHLIWIQEQFKMFNLAAEEHNWVAWYKETWSLKQSFPLTQYGHIC